MPKLSLRNRSGTKSLGRRLQRKSCETKRAANADKKATLFCCRTDQFNFTTYINCQKNPGAITILYGTTDPKKDLIMCALFHCSLS